MVTATAASHVVSTPRPGRVVIHALELFCGYDPEVDDQKSRASKYDADMIGTITDRTAARIHRGERPKLILGHNSKENANTGKPAIGDVVKVWSEDRNGVPYIVGDVEMSQADFDAYVASNRYPRRSAEIWISEMRLSEVALLGSETPGRPLPDTLFSKEATGEGDRESWSTPDDAAVEVWSRPVPVTQFSGFHGTGATSSPPKGNSDMDDTQKLKDELKAAKDELAKLKKKYSEQEEEEAEKNRKAAQDAEKFAAERDEAIKKLAVVTAERDAAQSAAKRERFTRELDEAKREGYSFGENADAALDRIIGADDPEAELKFLKSIATRVPAGVVIDQEKFAQPMPEGEASTDERWAKVQAARDAALKGDNNNRRDAFSAALSGKGA